MKTNMSFKAALCKLTRGFMGWRPTLKATFTADLTGLILTFE